jgi:hypothetical protein
MLPLDDKSGRRRLPAAAWRVLLESYRTHFPAALPQTSLPVRPARVMAEPWHQMDVGPWAKCAFAGAFASLVLFPALFPVTFPVGSLVALVLAISHVNRRLDEQPVWIGPTGGNALPRSPYDEWVRDGRATHRAVESALVRLPRGMRRTFWPLTQQSEDLVQSLQRLALRAQQMDDYLNSEAASSLRERAASLRTQCERAEDPIVREHLTQAGLSLESALRDQNEMSVHLERVKAQAAHVNATLQHVLAQLVKQRFTSPDGAWRDYQAAAERLKAVRYQIDAVEQVTSPDLFNELR